MSDWEFLSTVLIENGTLSIRGSKDFILDDEQQEKELDEYKNNPDEFQVLIDNGLTYEQRKKIALDTMKKSDDSDYYSLNASEADPSLASEVTVYGKNFRLENSSQIGEIFCKRDSQGNITKLKIIL